MKVKLLHNLACFEKGTPYATGFDIRCVDISYKGDGLLCLHLGIAVEPPVEHYFELVPRSSFSKTGFIMANEIGIIDEDYRGEVKMMVRYLYKDNLNEPFLMRRAKELFLNNKVAQMILKQNLSRHRTVTFDDELTESVRGSGSFGSTGK